MRLTVELVLTGDDLPRRDSTVQAEFGKFSSELRAGNISFSQRAMTFDGVGAAAFPVGQYILDIATIIQPILITAISGWFLSRRGRKVKISFDGNVLEANSVEELERLSEILQAARTGRPLNRGIESSNPDAGRQN